MSCNIPLGAPDHRYLWRFGFGDYHRSTKGESTFGFWSSVSSLAVFAAVDLEFYFSTSWRWFFKKYTDNSPIHFRISTGFLGRGHG